MSEGVEEGQVSALNKGFHFPGRVPSRWILLALERFPRSESGHHKASEPIWRSIHVEGAPDACADVCDQHGLC